MSVSVQAEATAGGQGAAEGGPGDVKTGARERPAPLGGGAGVGADAGEAGPGEQASPSAPPSSSPALPRALTESASPREADGQRLAGWAGPGRAWTGRLAPLRGGLGAGSALAATKPGAAGPPSQPDRVSLRVYASSDCTLLKAGLKRC